MHSLLLSVGIAQSNQPKLGLGECGVNYGIFVELAIKNLFYILKNNLRLKIVLKILLGVYAWHKRPGSEDSGYCSTNCQIGNWNQQNYWEIF